MTASEPYGLFVNAVGSHMWSMQTEQSDVDLALVYIVDTNDLLAGHHIPTKKNRIFQEHGTEYDIQYYELGHIMNLLLKGNVNAIWAVCSPVQYPLFEMNAESINSAVPEPVMQFGARVKQELKSLVESNLSKNSYFSIRGMAESQYLDHEKRKDVMPPGKALKTCIRTCMFGIELLTNNRLVFAQPAEIKQNNLKMEAEWYLTQLDETFAYKSQLPDTPPENQFRDFLLKCRLAIL
jgi:predicted nucleotidyltransferase